MTAVTIDSGTAIDPEAVIAEVLDTTPSPTAAAIVNALKGAGCVIVPPADGPGWMPKTKKGLARVTQYAKLAAAGGDLPGIAASMQMSVRSAERYRAAAHALGFLTE